MSLTESIGDLHAAVEIAQAKVPGAVGEAALVLDRAVQRRSLTTDATVISVAGPTGAGKSSLVNAIVGRPVTRASAIRPTTAQPVAVTNTPAAEILDWFGITERHEAPLTDAGAAVLIDLPDVDSTNFDHREAAHRLTELVDVVVWVLDPQKYADAVVHEDYLAELAEHAATTIVVLNQVDRLDEATLADVLADTRRLLRADGLEVPVLPVSATTGRGVDALRARIDDIVAERAAAEKKLAADIRTESRNMLGRIHADGGRPATTAADVPFEPVASALAVAAGSRVVAKASADSYERRARQATGWPVTRWLARRGIDPLKRLRLDTGGVLDVVAYVSPSQAAVARGKIREYVEASTAHMPAAWAHQTREELGERAERLIGGLDTALSGVDVEARRRPAWWLLMNLLQWLALAAAIAGGVWLLGLAFADSLQLRLSEPPGWGIFPLPTLMLAGGLLAGWLLAAIGRVLAGHGARRMRQRVGARIDVAFADKARAELAVLDEERSAYAHLQELLGGLTKSSA